MTHRDNSVRLKELLVQIEGLDTRDVRKLVDNSQKVISYARSIRQEIGMPVNPLVPVVCRKTVGDCGCNGKCPPELQR